MGSAEREITEAVDLCRDDGSLNPAAVGFSRRPLHRANLTGWGRKKQWEYWGLVSDTHIVGVTLANLDYAGLYQLFVLDRATGVQTGRESVVPLVRDAVLPRYSGEGTARSAGGRLSVEIKQGSAGTLLRASAAGVSVAAEIEPGGESLGVVVPMSRRSFAFTVKDVGRAFSGTLDLDGTQHDLSGFAVLDHGRGKWPYAASWNWAAGYSPTRRVGLNLGGRWTDGTGSTENGLFVDGRLHKIGEDVRWFYDRTDWTRPWQVRGTRVSVTFTPEHVREARTNLGVVAGTTVQCFGSFSGWMADDAGERVSVDGLTGWAEEARNRW